MLKITMAAAVAPLVPRAIELTRQRNTQTPGQDDEEKRDAASLNVASGRRLLRTTSSVERPRPGGPR